METVYWVREIVEKGAQWFAAQGRNGRGLRSFSVSGRVKSREFTSLPQVTVLQLINEFCGGMLEVTSFTPTCPAPPEVSCPRRRPTSRSTSIRCSRTAASSARRRLSCCPTKTKRAYGGQPHEVLPRRVVRQVHALPGGNGKAVALMEQAKWNQPLLNELSQAMMDASICGLGQAAPNPALSVMKYFPHEIAG